MDPTQPCRSADNTPRNAFPVLMYVLIGFTGILIAGIVGYGFHMGDRMNTLDAPLVNGAAKIKLEATIAGLMFEEIFNSGIVGDFEENWEPLDMAIKEMQAELKEGQKRRVPLLLFRSVAGLEEIQKVAERLSSLKEIARDRLLNPRRSLITVNADQLYQEAFTELIMGINSLENRLRQGMEKNLQRFHYTQIFLIAACIALSLTVSIAFFRFERHRSKMLQSLIETQELMEKEIAEKNRAEQALFERTRALEKSNRDLEQFAYVASHDLQEPLRMVTSYMQLLERRYHGKLDKDADDFIAFAKDGADRMQEMIRALLLFSRVGSAPKSSEPVKTDDVLDAVLTALKVAVSDSDATITVDQLPVVQADAVQLNQLFQNLISNAIKFKGDAAPKIHVSATREDDFWVFAVKDNGIGVDPKFSKKIFTIFKRLHSVADYPGTGIGLAICRKIVESHGGRIWMTSNQGSGATFHFTLPADKGTYDGNAVTA